MKNMHVLNESELQNIEGGWDKTAFEWGKRIGRMSVSIGSMFIPTKK
ncbi:bacteriocin [Companilactobacillus nantensis]|nr:bacteriocin [Companilactobacillus nantensis]GEO64603.1 hypothetical protein LNA01_17860 [Companilactobacillus nantensis]